MADNTLPLALVVDDQDDILEIITLTLKYEGWRVAVAHNGRQALAAVREETPDLILADLMMPEMTGIEFCRKLVEDFKLGDVPVLMISGVSESAKILNDFWQMPLRHHNFLHKPFTTEELLGAVQTILPPQHPMATHGAPHAAPGASPATAAHAAAKAAPKPPPAPGAPAAASRVVAPFKPEAGRGYRILVIDDDPDIRVILKTTLSMFHTVAEAASGMEGIELVDHFGPDIIISDINMPGMNGLETAAAIRRHPAYGGVPIFFLTAETDTNLPRQAYEVGGNLFLRKPMDPIQLLKFIDHFLVETGLRPGQLHTLAAQPAPARPAPAPQAPPKPAPPKAGPPQKVRVLVIDYKLEHHERLKDLLVPAGGAPPKVAGGPFEPLFCEERALALGNLARWEPDLILYNARNHGMDGVAFGQTLVLSKLPQKPEVAFIGEQFFPPEVQYSHDHYKREPIRMDGSPQEVAARLGEAAVAARAHLHPKRLSYAQLHGEEVERLRRLQADSTRTALQQEDLRQRYAKLQEFIDRQMF